MVAAHRTDDRLDRVEVHVVYDTAVAGQAVPTPHPLASPPLDRQRSCIIHIHKPITTSTTRHGQVGTPRAPQQVPAGALLLLTHASLTHRVTTHQLHAPAFALEEGVDVPHAQARVQRVAQSTTHAHCRRAQIAAVRGEADSRD